MSNPYMKNKKKTSRFIRQLCSTFNSNNKYNIRRSKNRRPVAFSMSAGIQTTRVLLHSRKLFYSCNTALTHWNLFPVCFLVWVVSVTRKNTILLLLKRINAIVNGKTGTFLCLFKKKQYFYIYNVPVYTKIDVCKLRDF